MTANSHFDGRRFHNLDPAAPRGLGLILRWMLTRRRTRWPDWVEDPPQPPPSEDPPPPGHARLTYIGHSTFLIAFAAPDGACFRVLTDPVFSERCSPVRWAGPRRVRAPGVPLERLPHVHAVLLSHNHYDHMDLPSLRALHERFAPKVVTPLGNARILVRAGLPGAAELDWWEEAPLGPVRVVATPARHFSRRGLLDTDRALWAGFMLRLDGRQLFYAGDSGAGRHWAAIRDRLGPPGLALLPIGAYLPRSIMQPVHMDPAEAVQARAELGATRAIGMHFGTFQLTDEGIADPIRALDAARDRAGLLRDAFDVLGFGETRDVPFA